jgi:hypothetical protein
VTTDPAFSLDEDVIVIMIDQMCRGGFETYSFVINSLIKHVDAKAYNSHIVTGCMKLGELILVGQQALGLLLWRTIGHHGSKL